MRRVAAPTDAGNAPGVMSPPEMHAALANLARLLAPFLLPILRASEGIEGIGDGERISHKRLAAEQGISTRAAIGLVRSLPGAAAVGHGRGRLWTAPAAEVRAALAGKHTESDATPEAEAEADPFERAMARARLKRGAANDASPSRKGAA